MAILHVHATPKSNRDEIAGWRGGELSVRVTAPPEDGKANAAVCKVIAKALGVPKSAVSVTRGEASRHKTVEVEGVEQDAVEHELGAAEKR
ncbi:MAG: YggU family protein [Actinobacteria bacterium HGW-Actinobacteria-1]|jgi:hypothetical protein|nr:MAG: YggU family protein [Actinobacteria bacterium HGW-Actinobacteria-1]